MSYPNLYSDVKNLYRSYTQSNDLFVPRETLITNKALIERY
jgi:hypothetical protein